MAGASNTGESTIWMNVTTSANWKRSPVGIVRTERELLRALEEVVGDRLRQVVYEDGAFVLHGSSSAKADRESEDFWPELPEIRSVDPFDPLKNKAPIRRAVAPVNPKQPQFQTGDILITVGLDWNQAGLYDCVRKEVLRTGLSVITCCYDLIPVHYPQYCVGDVASWFKNYLIGMSWSSDGVLCISENTQRDFVEFSREIGLPEIPTKVIRLGSSLPEDPGSDDLSDAVSSIIKSRYFLYVSTIERRKNHAVLYRAYHLLKREQPELELPKLVFVGMHGWGVDDLISDIKLDPLIQDDIVVLNHVSDAELGALYRNCHAFLFPSFYEGWGLPVAEALELGRPVLASNAGSIPEVGGDLVRYVDPWSPRDWAKELASMATGETDIKSWSEKIRSEFKPFEWSKVAHDVLDLIAEISDGRDTNRTFAPGYDLSTLNGVHYEDKIIFMEPEGVVCHGPYLALAAGHYRAQLFVTLLSGENGTVRFSVKSNSGQNVIAERSGNLDRLELGHLEVDMDFRLSDYLRDVEFVVEVVADTQVKISIDKIELRTRKN